MEFSIVIPVFNSAGHIRVFINEVARSAQNINEAYEVICIDDGSRDNTWTELCQLKDQIGDRLKVVRLAKNFGQHNATLCGLCLAKGEIVVTMDDDGRHRPDSIPFVYNKFKEESFSFMYALPSNAIDEDKFRRQTSRLWKRSAKAFNHSTGKGSSYRLFSRKLVDKLTRHTQSFVFIDELVHWYVDQIAVVEIPFGQSLRESNYNRKKLLKKGLDLALFYSAAPLRFLAYSGIFFMVCSLLSGLYFIADRLMGAPEIPKWIIIIHVVVFCSSVILCSIGLFGQYLARIHETLNTKPNFFIQEKR